jgi:hypothetical protein
MGTFIPQSSKNYKIKIVESLSEWNFLKSSKIG